jgi:hypothetical protein
LRGQTSSGSRYRECNNTLPSPVSRSRIYAWWYLTIALGFLLLAVNKALTGDKTWLIVLRFVIAAGFATLGYAEFRSRSQTK